MTSKTGRKDGPDPDPDPDHDHDIRASGGVLLRASAVGELVEVLLVHRPRYDDWTLPKGKREKGETDESCALREVAEETGYRCELGTELLSTSYYDHKGRSKLVRYWAMTDTAGKFCANDEVDAIAWLPLDEAIERLSYDRDRPILATVDRTQPPDEVR